MGHTERCKSNQDLLLSNREQLWDTWYKTHHVMLHKLRIPSEALVDYLHFYDFVFDYSDTYEFPIYTIHALSDREILCLYRMLESFYECFYQNMSSDYTKKTMLDARLDSMLYRDMLIRSGFDLYCNEIPNYSQFAKKVIQENKSNQDILYGNREQLWNTWYKTHYLMLRKLRVPSEALVDYLHFFDFVYNYSDIYEIPIYTIDTLSDCEILCLYRMLESFFAYFQYYEQIECKQIDYAEECWKLLERREYALIDHRRLDDRLESRLYCDLLKRYEYDYICMQIPKFSLFVKRIMEKNAENNDIQKD